MILSDKKVLVSNIQRYSLHDGPGIRTTVFLKGCSLHCPWCSNPENIIRQNQIWFDRSKCLGSEETCPLNKSCNFGYALSLSGKEVIPEWSNSLCLMRALQFVAKEYSLGELEAELRKDQEFWKLEGGITFSGGEPLLWMEHLEEIMERFQKESIHQCVETALFVPDSMLEMSFRYVNLFIVDMKIMDMKKCINVIGGNLAVYEKNLLRLSESLIPFILRIPLIEPFITEEDNIRKICEFISENRIKPLKIELLKGHNLAANKYISLGRSMEHVPLLSTNRLTTIYEMISSLGIQTEVCSV